MNTLMGVLFLENVHAVSQVIPAFIISAAKQLWFGMKQYAHISQ